MRTHLTADQKLVVVHDSTLLPKWIFGGGVVLVTTAAYDYFLGPRGTDRIVALLASTAVCLGAGLVLLERSRFEFDPATRTISWRRLWGWSRCGGTVPFDRVSSVLVQTMGEYRNYPDRRICLQLADGEQLPLAAGYAPDPAGELPDIAESIRGILSSAGVATPAPLEALVGAGQILDAIRLLREQGLSVTEAKKRVDDLRRRQAAIGGRSGRPR